MNAFRLIADMSHLAAIIILLVKIWKTRSCAGISGKSQILFALVFTTRYLDLFFDFVSVYNSAMKTFFLISSYTTVYLIYVEFKIPTPNQDRAELALQRLIPADIPREKKQWGEGRHITTTIETVPDGSATVEVQATYDHNVNHDTFHVEYLLTPCVVLSLLIQHGYNPNELLWTFSIFLESVAILPQLSMVSKTGEAETITSHYLFALGSYRAFYILNWIYRYYTEDFFDGIVVAAGILQTVLYVDFFYLYFTRVLKGKEFRLPA